MALATAFIFSSLVGFLGIPEKLGKGKKKKAKGLAIVVGQVLTICCGALEKRKVRRPIPKPGEPGTNPAALYVLNAWNAPTTPPSNALSTPPTSQEKRRAAEEQARLEAMSPEERARHDEEQAEAAAWAAYDADGDGDIDVDDRM